MAMMSADTDLGHLCAPQHGDGHHELPGGHWRKQGIAGVQHKMAGVRISSSWQCEQYVAGTVSDPNPRIAR